MNFAVDARGACMLGRRHSGLRFIIPPNATSHPTRVQCKLVSREKLSCAPPLSEAEALAARLLDFGPTRVKFDRFLLLSPLHRRLLVKMLTGIYASTFLVAVGQLRCLISKCFSI